jgi:PAS domain S-box-containing protein
MKNEPKTKEHLLEGLAGLQRRLLNLAKSNKELRKEKVALMQSEKQFRLIFENAPEGIFQTTPDGRFISMNPAFANLCGYDSPEDMIHGISDIKKQLYLNPEDRDQVKKILMERGILKGFETPFYRKDGGVIWVSIYIQSVTDEDGTIFYLGTIEDITKRKHIQDALQASEVRYRRLFETAQDGILIIDAETGQIIDVNPFLMDMLDYSHKDFVGKRLWEIGTFKDIEASKAAFAELHKKEYIRYENLPLETKDGRSINVEFVSNAYLVNGKKIIQCNIRDITDRKKVEIERERLILELQKALSEIKKLSGMLPICSSCKNIRNDKGYWEQIESYIHDRSEAEFSHGMCPDCAKRLYPELYKKKIEGEKRHYPRKKVSFSALVSTSDSDNKASLQTGLVLDISLGGVQISIPGAHNFETGENRKTCNISITFTLPNSKVPVTIECLPQYVLSSNSATYIGASLVDTDIESHKALQQYLN